jgi:outer membrane protein TolC
MKLAPISYSILIALSTGCVQFKSKTLSAEASSMSFAGRTLSDAGLRAFLAEQRAGGAWTVDKLALAAAYFHGDVRVAKAQADEAEAAITTAAQRPNPVLSFAPGYNSTSKGISPWIITPSVDVPIETAGKRGKRIVQAQAESEAARLMIAAVAWDVRAKVRAAMLALHTGQENAALIKEEIVLHEEALKKLDVQVKAGEASAFELTSSRLLLNRSKLALHDAEKQTSTGMAQLAAAVGVPSSALSAVKLDFSSFQSLPSVPGDAARRKALTHRADLLALLANYRAAEEAVRVEISKQYPDVHLGPGYDFDQGENKWTLGFSVELPAFNRNRGGIAQAEAKRATEAAKFEAKQAAVFGEIETALASYHAAQAKVVTAAQLAEDSIKASETTKRIVDAGELGTLDLVRHRIEASAAKLSKLEATLQAQEAAGLLEAALQLPLRSL